MSSAYHAGRKRESKIWNYFEYEESIHKSVCKVKDGNTKRECGFLLAGKNTTNLITHLSRRHKEQYEDFRLKAARNSIANADQLKTIKSEPKSNNVRVVTRFLNGNIVLHPSHPDEQKIKTKYILDYITGSGLPLTYIEEPPFRAFVQALDERFDMPGFEAFKDVILEEYHIKQNRINMMLIEARKISICIDIQTKSSNRIYVWIFASFFHSSTNKPVQCFLNLKKMSASFSSNELFSLLEECFSQWNIPHNKILQIISGNGSNHMTSTESETECESLYEEEDDDDYIDENDNEELPELKLEEHKDFGLTKQKSFYYLPCLANEMQSLVKIVYFHYRTLLVKAHQLVHIIRRSTLIKDQLILQYGKAIISNLKYSTFSMLKNLVNLKQDLDNTLMNQGMATFHENEWFELEEIYTLLEPFTTQIDILQRETLPISNVLPAILNLECHLQQSAASKELCAELLNNLKQRFSNLLDPLNPYFNPLPAAASLLDPTIKDVLCVPDMNNHLQAAKEFILSLDMDVKMNKFMKPDNDCSTEYPLKRFKFLSSKMKMNAHLLAFGNLDTLPNQLNRYIIEMETCESDVLQFWIEKELSSPQLSSIAEDLISVPGSQILVKCITSHFSRKKELDDFLEIKAFLKFNKDVL